MPNGPHGDHCLADVIGEAVKIVRIVAGKEQDRMAKAAR